MVGFFHRSKTKLPLEGKQPPQIRLFNPDKKEEYSNSTFIFFPERYPSLSWEFSLNVFAGLLKSRTI